MLRRWPADVVPGLRVARVGMVAAVLAAAKAPVPATAQQGPSIGRPSPAALATARGKEDAMRRPNGPGSVSLDADEMASLLEAGLHPNARRALDSLSVRLEPGRLVLQAYLVTAIWGADVLGPLALMLGPLEPLEVSGPARSARPGVVAWEPDTFRLRTFALPHVAIPGLVRQLTGGTDGTIPIGVPPTISRVEIGAGRVTFSR